MIEFVFLMIAGVIYLISAAVQMAWAILSFVFDLLIVSPIKNYISKRKLTEAPKNKDKLWPHCDSPDIDVEYFKALQVPAPAEDMKKFITAYPLDPGLDPHKLPNEQIITIISEPFDREDHAEYFAAVVAKHHCSVTNIIGGNGEFFVIIRSHVYSVMSNYFKHCNNTVPTYRFSN